MYRCLFVTLICLLMVPATAQDRFGDPLPEGAVQRLGTLRMKCGARDIRYLPDGRGVIALGNSIEIWDLEKGEVVATHQVADSTVRCMQVSADGSRFLFADAAGNVVEWSLESGERTHLFPTGQAGLRWAFYSPDETRVLTTGGVPPTLKEWDLATGEELVSIEGDFAVFNKAIYGPEGKTAFVGGGYDTILAHYDLATGEKLNEWFTNYTVYDLCLSPDGERLLVASRSMASEWRIDGYELLQKFTGHHGGAVNGVSYCHEPEQILTGSRDGSIRRWDRVEGKILLRWFPHESYANITRVSPDGKRVLSYGAGLVAESSLATGEPSLSWERHAGAVYGAALTPDGRQVVSASADGTLRVWDVATGESVLVIEGATLGRWRCRPTGPRRSPAARTESSASSTSPAANSCAR
jgi:WD40 repeat protein